MNLYSGLPYKDRLGNDIYPDYRNMLRFEQVLASADMTELEKSLACLKLFYGDDIPDSPEAGFKELLWFYYRGEELEKPKGRINQLFDFEEDAPYMISAYRSAYGIDLTDESLHVHWWMFMSLFIALPEETQMMKRMCDRNLDTSKMKGEMRQYYEARKKAAALKGKRQQIGGTLAERKQAKQDRLDALYAEAERNLAKRGDAAT